MRGSSVKQAFLILRSSDGKILGRRSFLGMELEGPTELVIEEIFPEISLSAGHSGSVEVELYFSSKPRFTYPAISMVYSSQNSSSLVHTAARFLNKGEKVDDPFIAAPQTGFDVTLEETVDNYFVAFIGRVGILELEITLGSPPNEVRKKITLRGNSGSLHVLDLNFLDLGNLRKINNRPKVSIEAKQTDIFPRYFCMIHEKSAPVPTLTHSFFDIRAAISRNPDLLEAATAQPIDKSMHSAAFLAPFFDPSKFETSIETYDCWAPFTGEVTVNLRSEKGKVLGTRRFNSEPGGFFQRRESIHVADLFTTEEVSLGGQVEMIISVDGRIPIRQKIALNIRKREQSVGTNICFSPHTNPEPSQADALRHHWFPLGGPDQFVATLHNTCFSSTIIPSRLFDIKIFTSKGKCIEIRKSLAPSSSLVLSPESLPAVFKQLNGQLGYAYVESKGMPFNSFFFSVKKDGVGGDHAF